MRVTTKTESKCKLNHRQDLSEGGSPGTLVRVPESQEGPREFLKDPIAVAIYVYFDVFIFFFLFVFSTQILNLEKSFSLFPGSQSSLVPPCKISLGGPDHRSNHFNIYLVVSLSVCHVQIKHL